MLTFTVAPVLFLQAPTKASSTLDSRPVSQLDAVSCARVYSRPTPSHELPLQVQLCDFCVKHKGASKQKKSKIVKQRFFERELHGIACMVKLVVARDLRSQSK